MLIRKRLGTSCPTGRFAAAPERAVERFVERLGRFAGVLDAGFHNFLVPFARAAGVISGVRSWHGHAQQMP